MAGFQARHRCLPTFSLSNVDYCVCENETVESTLVFLPREIKALTAQVKAFLLFFFLFFVIVRFFKLFDFDLGDTP